MRSRPKVRPLQKNVLQHLLPRTNAILHLQDIVRASNRQVSSSPTPTKFDPMYRSLLEEQGKKLSDKREPYSTRFIEHLVSLLSEWTEISQGKEIYMSTKTKVAELIAKAHDTQIHQNDALLLMSAA